MRCVIARVEGRVQGVFFRDFTKRQAGLLQLTGWVENKADGSVETMFCGREENIDKMISWLHQGSPHSHVTKVVVTEEDDQHLTDFSIIF